MVRLITVAITAHAGTKGSGSPSRSVSISAYVPAWISVMVGSASVSRIVEVPAEDTVPAARPERSKAAFVSASAPYARAIVSARPSRLERSRPS